MHPEHIEIAILKTLLYGDIFDFPMTPAEIHHFLIGESAPREKIENTLQSSAWLAQRIIRVNGYYAARPEAAEKRHHRAIISKELWEAAQGYGVWLGHLPFVRFVALTGALAMQNASSKDDDFDYLIITTEGRVWLTRLMAVIIVRVAKLWGVTLCPNYVMSLSALPQHRRDLYIAHEIAQMVSICGHDVYEAMRSANTWSDAMMPNARGCFYPLPDRQPRGFGKKCQLFLEWLLSGRIGNWLERWEQHRKQKRFRAEVTTQSAAELDADRVKGHFKDYGQIVLERFHARLQEFEIE